MTDFSDTEALLSVALDKAKAHGAEAADALLYRSVSESVSVRLGEVEDIERSEGRDLGLRVLMGQRQATVSTTDFSPEALEELAERAVRMATLAPEDPYCGLADEGDLAKGPFEDLELYDGAAPDAESLKARALACEEAARAVEGVTNSSGAGASFGYGQSWFATSHGFFGTGRGGQHGVSVSVLAGEGTGMERDYDYDAAVFLADLRSPEAVGKRAGERTVRRLGPKKVKSQTAPVIFDQRVATALLSPLAGAINGASIARGTSFLKEKMGEKLFAESVQVTDDPFIRRGFGSRPFDGEGLRPQKIEVIKDGVLTSWLLNTSQARQLGLKSNARARRGTGGPPGSGTTNFDLQPGPKSPADLMGEVKYGLYLTDMFGPQINGNTGDFSVGCSGFWIEDGEIVCPVSEITIAGNLLEMWAGLEPASDFVRRGSTNAPTLKVAEMQIAGN